MPDLERSRQTDYMGWTWCRASDGSEGWVPTGWLAPEDGGMRVSRDYSAVELTVHAGDEVELEHSESGFVFVRNREGKRGWIPDAILRHDGT